MHWRNENELKPDDLSYEDKYNKVVAGILLNIKRQAYLNKDWEVLQNFNFVQSNDEEDDAEFSVINRDLLDLYLVDIKSVTHLLFKNDRQPSAS